MVTVSPIGAGVRFRGRVGLRASVSPRTTRSRTAVPRTSARKAAQGEIRSRAAGVSGWPSGWR